MTRRGAVMIFVLLIVAVGAVVLAGWAHMLVARAQFSEEADLAQHRRLALHNSRALADQWILSGAASGTINSTAAAYTVGGTNWGNFRVADTASNALTTANSNAWSGNRNPFSPMGAGGYVTNVSAILFQTNVDREGVNRATTLTRSYAVRSRSPIAAGYPLVLHTNAAATNFTRLSVVTNNAPALVFAQPASSAVAPVSPLYFAPVARTVLSSTNTGAPPAEMVETPFAPLTSGASGFGGQLDTPVPRLLPSANLSASATASLPTPPTITDILKPDGTSEYRALGTLPTMVQVFPVNFDNIATTHGPSMMLGFGQPPDQPPQQTGPNKIKYYYFGREFEIKYASSNVQYGKEPNWNTLNADLEIIVFNADGSVTVENLATAGRIDLTTAGSQRTILFVPPDGALLVYTNTSIYIRGDPSFGVINGAAVYRKTDYMVPNGVSFILVSGTSVGGAFAVGDSMLSRLNPAGIYRCDLSDGMRVIQLQTNGSTYDINDNAGEPLIWVRPSLTPMFVLAASGPSASPVLHHLSTVTAPVANGTPISFRRWLGVFDPTQTINPANSLSAMLFGYLDTGTAALGLEDDENSRLTALDFSGDNNGLTLNVPANRLWNLSALFAGTPVNVVSAGAPTVVGGIRSDRSVNVSTNRLNVTKSTSGAALEPFLDRIGWVESWQQ